MAEIQLLGFFDEATATAEGVDRLRRAGVSDESVSVMTGVPYRPRMLRRPAIASRIATFAGIGALVGVILGLAVTAGTYLLYPLSAGGQPLIPIPPTLIIVFELTMLGMMWAAFGGFFVVNRLPVFGKPPFDERIVEGLIGVQVVVEERRASEIEHLLREAGASDVRRFDQAARANEATWMKFMGGLGAAATLVLIAVLLLSFEVIKIPFPTNMADQVSVAHLQGPRLAAPAEAVPVQGPVFIAGQPAFASVASSPASIQRGQVLFGINCLMCHGEKGQGNGRLAAYFNPKPADLTGEKVRAYSDSDIFLVISLGRGQMPSLAENLSPASRWDVINFVRSLQK